MALCPSPSVLPEERAAGRLVTLWACWGAGKRAGLVGESGQDRSIRMGLGGHQEVQPRITGRPHLGAQSPQPGHLPLFSFQLWGRGGGRRASRGPRHPASFSVPLRDQGSQGRPYWVTSAYRGPLAGPLPAPPAPAPSPAPRPLGGLPSRARRGRLEGEWAEPGCGDGAGGVRVGGAGRREGRARGSPSQARAPGVGLGLPGSHQVRLHGPASPPGRSGAVPWPLLPALHSCPFINTKART